MPSELPFPHQIQPKSEPQTGHAFRSATQLSSADLASAFSSVVSGNTAQKENPQSLDTIRKRLEEYQPPPSAPQEQIAATSLPLKVEDLQNRQRIRKSVSQAARAREIKELPLKKIKTAAQAVLDELTPQIEAAKAELERLHIRTARAKKEAVGIQESSSQQNRQQAEELVNTRRLLDESQKENARLRHRLQYTLPPDYKPGSYVDYKIGENILEGTFVNPEKEATKIREQNTIQAFLHENPLYQKYRRELIAEILQRKGMTTSSEEYKKYITDQLDQDPEELFKEEEPEKYQQVIAQAYEAAHTKGRRVDFTILEETILERAEPAASPTIQTAQLSRRGKARKAASALQASKPHVAKALAQPESEFLDLESLLKETPPATPVRR